MKQSTVDAKRAAITPLALRRKRERGEHVDEKTRAIVRMSATNTQILIGADDLSTWTDEELRFGAKRGPKGFPNKPPSVIPKALHDELVRRVLLEAQAAIRDAVMPSMDVLLAILNGADSEDKDRIKVAEMILNRFLGKEPLRVEVTAHKTKFEEALDAVLVPDDEDDVLDAESWEEDDDGDNDEG